MECLRAIKSYVTENTYVWTSDEDKIKRFLADVLPGKNCDGVLTDIESERDLNEEQVEQATQYLREIQKHIVKP
jgi:hypothetical protein